MRPQQAPRYVLAPESSPAIEGLFGNTLFRIREKRFHWDNNTEVETQGGRGSQGYQLPTGPHPGRGKDIPTSWCLGDEPQEEQGGLSEQAFR